jgi:SAM-dependent methyltransferase
MEERKDHWENVFATKAENEVSWFQSYPHTSVKLLEECNPPLDGNVIDVGGGDSHFVDVLIDKGYRNIFVLDISANAIERAKKRLGKKAEQVNWIISDSSGFVPPVQFDFWHDRASFHFQTDEQQKASYASIASGYIKPDGHLVLGTFSDKGPEKCSGLKICQYNSAAMTERFSLSFDTVKCFTEDHQTPFNTLQNFMFCIFRKK